MSVYLLGQVALTVHSCRVGQADLLVLSILPGLGFHLPRVRQVGLVSKVLVELN